MRLATTGLCAISMALITVAGVRAVAVELDRVATSALLMPGVDLDALFALYASGDFDSVSQRLASAGDFPDASSVEKLVARWRTDWQAARATFLLEVAIAASRVGSPQLVPILSAGRVFLASRPQNPEAGSSAATFERRWHRAAIGLLQGTGSSTAQQTYLAAVETRAKSLGNTALDPRILLAEAIALTHRCCTEWRLSRLDSAPRPVDGTGPRTAAINRDPPTGDVSNWGFSPPPEPVNPDLERAVAAFRRAARIPDCRPEALVRGAFLLRRGHPDQSLQWLDQFDVRNPDRQLVYWANLVRGRVLDDLHRPADAESAYRAALDSWPHAQSAGIGLAIDLLRLGRGSEAATVAAEVRTTFADTHDPWWNYDGADARFVIGWRDELRKASQ